MFAIHQDLVSHFIAPIHRDRIAHSNSHYETNFGVFSACGAENTKIGLLKARLRWAFNKPIFIIRIAALPM
jgi:hypothetical protein